MFRPTNGWISTKQQDDSLREYIQSIMNSKETSRALELIQAERIRQLEKWGDQSSTHPFEWMSILGEEYGELCEAVNETFFRNGAHPNRGGYDKIIKEAVQVAAVAVALIEPMLKKPDPKIFDASFLSDRSRKDG